jgi:predicted RNA-binding Zn-ribbon protein involved in translation (DUF1610 family)
MQKFTCAHCGGRIAVSPRHTSKLVVCPDCGKPTHPLATEILEAAKGPTSPRSPSAEPIERKCENCGRAIGRLETVQLWQNHVVCNDCHARLAPPEPAPEKRKPRATKKPLPEPEPAENAIVVLPRGEATPAQLSPAASSAPTIIIDTPRTIPVAVSRVENPTPHALPYAPVLPVTGQRKLLVMLAVVFVAGAAMYGALTLLRDLMGILTMIAFGLMAVAAGTVAIKLLLGYVRRRIAGWRLKRAGASSETALEIFEKKEESS